MRGALALLTALAILAILRIALVVLAVSFAILLLFFLVTQPRETLTYFGSLVLIGLLSERPMAVIVTLGVVILTLSFFDPRRRSRQHMRLTDQQERL